MHQSVTGIFLMYLCNQCQNKVSPIATQAMFVKWN